MSSKSPKTRPTAILRRRMLNVTPTTLARKLAGTGAVVVSAGSSESYLF
ncbi:hypothetical protein A2U01_0037422 [Trifolium medium]|uniref:Uncharacterized protein n=1 Tax=Trifolium medium TaxID=97028 RepID=A0A392PXW6_9FABA|nr:hypothetical protein [Trifolium medium]